VGSTHLRRKKADSILHFESLFFKNITINSESLRDKLGIRAKKSHILPLGSDELSKTDKSFEAMNLLYVGVLSSRNIEDTVFALSKFINRYKDEKIDITYDIFGHGTKEAERLLTDSIVATGLEDIVTFHGARNHTELQEYFDNCNIGVAYIPQVDYYECQPSTKIFEYVRAGLLTIATGTFENRRLITRENGILCSDNVDSFSDALEEIYIHRDKFESQKIRETLKDSSWYKIVNSNLKKYFKNFLD
ncbi:glycosyltransferase family 4 protein, partial [Sulfurovum sp. bin170]|uniref:glycosyltransferase n=1 Tax=Sulfurovum sp. bin170 TaxID=2695268 RepID=UPI0013E07505